MKILCVGDSLGLPREGVAYEDTWFYELVNKYREDHFIYKFKRGLTSEYLIGLYGKEYKGEFSSFYMPDVVIMQSGIVDCAPRYINDYKGIGKIISRISKFLRIETLFWRIVKIINKRSSRHCYVKFEDFKRNINQYINELISLGVRKIIIVKIGIPSEKIQERSVELVSCINKYNSVYDELADQYEKTIAVINPLGSGDESLYIDGYHTNKKGANLVFEDLCQVLDGFKKH